MGGIVVKNPVVAQQNLTKDDFLDIVMGNTYVADVVCEGVSLLT